MKMGNFDVYLAPALEELQDLWNGVKAMDVLAPPESREFTLKAMLIWRIHDFWGYDLVSRCQQQGYKACPPCGKNVHSRWSKELGKPIFEEVDDHYMKTIPINSTPMLSISMGRRSFKIGQKLQHVHRLQGKL
jgi:hypothetical protein